MAPMSISDGSEVESLQTGDRVSLAVGHPDQDPHTSIEQAKVIRTFTHRDDDRACARIRTGDRKDYILKANFGDVMVFDPHMVLLGHAK